MADTEHKLEQYYHAIQGLGASACSSALRCAIDGSEDMSSLDRLRRLAILASTSQRAGTCLSVIDKANADGDVAMVEHAGLQALAMLNRMAEIAGTTPAEATDHAGSSAPTALHH